MSYKRTNVFQLVLLSKVILICVPQLLHGQVTISKSQRGADVKIGDQLYAKYITTSGHQPVIWPIYGPTGVAMTRSFPVGPLESGELDDHPHHRSLWFSHGDVNGFDFWHEPQQRDSQSPKIQQRKIVTLENAKRIATLVTLNDWIAAGAVQCEDERTICFSANDQLRWIDFSIRLSAPQSKVTFGDTKEGTFGVRVPETMKLTAQQGGSILNSLGHVDGMTWGQPASWVHYSGSASNQEVGITIMNHPSSESFPTRWHVRDYGLFAANPFGKREFPNSDSSQGAITLSPGETLTFRYRVLLHGSKVTASDLEKLFIDFCKDMH